MKRLFVLCSLLLAGHLLFAQSNSELKLNPEKNKVYHLISTSNQTITQTINGNQQVTQTAVEYAISIKALDATPAFIVAEIHIDTMKTNTNTMGKVIKTSSANEGNLKSSESTDVISCIMNRASRNALYAKLDPTGKVIEIVNLKMFSDAVLQDTSSITLTGMTRAAVKKQAESLVSVSTLNTLIEMFTYRLPGKKVEKNESWAASVKTSAGGMSLQINTKYHLDGISENKAMVSAESEIKTAPDAEPIISGPAKVTYDDLRGLSKTNMVIDATTGLVTEEKSKTQISGNLGISGTGFSMTMPMEISGESKIKSL
jgi:hypothetical protein